MVLRIVGLGLVGMAVMTAATGALLAGTAAAICVARRRAKADAAWPAEPPADAPEPDPVP